MDIQKDSRIIAKNKQAYFEYFILEKFEAGIVLKGSEVKSIRMGAINLSGAFCFFERSELILKNLNITPYEKGSYFNTEAKRDRKLLMRKQEIRRLIGKVREKGLTLLPLSIYFKGSLVKVEIGLAQGKKLYDKRETVKERDKMREAEREIARYR